jgi:hypothetical protein
MSPIREKVRRNAGIHLQEFSLSRSEISNAIVTIEQQGFLKFRFESTREFDTPNRYELQLSMPRAERKEVAITIEGDAEMRELLEAMRAFVSLADRHPHLITQPDS